MQALGAGFHRTTPATRRLGLFNLGTRPRKVRRRYAQVGVGGHGLTHQFIQRRVLVKLPPISGHRCRDDVIALARQRALQVWTLLGRIFGQVIVRPDHLAAGQQQPQPYGCQANRFH